MLNFEFSEKGLRLVSPPHFVYDFSRKIFLMFYVTNWPNFIVWLTIIFKIIRNMCIVIVCEPGCDVINLKLTSSFQLICFPLWPKSQNKNLNILRMKELFKWNKKYFPSFLKVFQPPRPISYPHTTFKNPFALIKFQQNIWQDK